ncbi:2Fe-2S iron-sulfur cluster-binding protein [Streptomyces sp. NPDC048191]|uniref:2Fe-2S iron-sulfur cluster-binding protein n=1 Tax=Streptomyces sp. NPDC048191 TaxID=3155484 RepID=UPI0033CB12FF
MTDDQHGEGRPQGGRWDPLPQGDYDDGATAFVKLPEGGIDALLAGDSPLAAPGHGYVPPRIAADPGTGDPAAPGTWAAPAGGAEWPDPNVTPQAQQADDRFTYNPGATQHWTFEDPAAPAGQGHDVTGQWSIPVVGGDLPDESGEFTTSALVEQWGGTPPATLPGGAPAPWATDGAGHAWGESPADAEPAAGPDRAHPAGDTPAQDASYAREVSYGHAPAGYPEPGQPGAAPAETAQAAAGHPEFGHDRSGAESGHGHVEAGRPGAPADAQAPAQAPESPADGPAGHEGPTRHGSAPQAATTADTAGAPEHGAAAGAPHDTTGEAPGEPGEGPAAATPEASAHSAPGHPEHPEDQPGELPADAATAAAQAAEDEAAEESAAPRPAHDDHPLASYVLRVNGADRPVGDAWIGESLLYVLRERLGLAGAKDGCSQGECGACNVQVDGRLVASCLVPAVTAAGSEVRTVEGLATDGQPSDVQRALARCGAVQCGFCVPGMAMTLHDLLEGNPAPTELETRQALCGNLCRCSGYRGVLDAVQEVVAEREASHGADAEPDADEARIPHQAGPGAGGVNPSAFEAPGAFDTPQTAPGGYGDTPPYGTPDPFGTPPHGTPGPHGPHDQHYGQDGGQG